MYKMMEGIKSEHALKEMLKVIIKDLEDILEKTNTLRYELKYDCEHIWDILCPPGSINKGSFTIENKSTSNREQVSEISDNSNLECDSTLSDVSDLIAYGKQIRDLVKQGSKKSCAISKEFTTNNKNVNQNKDVTCVSKYRPTKTISTSKSLDEPIKNVKAPKTLTQTNKVIQKKAVELPLKSGEVKEGSYKIQQTNETEKRNECKDQIQTPIYSHSYAPTLSDILKTLKMPEELLHLLKHYYNYEQNKFQNNFKDKENRNHFRMRFSELTRLKLQRDIKMSNQNGDKFMKYIHIAGEINPEDKKATLSELYPAVQYNSKEQLVLYESKLHILFELKLQERLLDKINAFSSSVK